MKAMLLRVGIDKGTDGTLGPIFEDGFFEFIPISEGDGLSKEDRTYESTIGRSGKTLSTYVPKSIEKRVMHFDPEFETHTYGDPTSKRRYLLRLEKGDLLVFYAGLTPFNNEKQREGLYIIGYFTVDRVLDFNQFKKGEIENCSRIYPNNAHMKRSYDTKDLVIVVGDRNSSRLLEKAIPISQTKHNRIGKSYQAVSREMEDMLGISGSIQRSIPPRFIMDESNLKNLKHILGL